MIITRTPFRVSFLGGGTDLPWFYNDSPGIVISTAIDKYIYIAGHEMFDSNKTLLKYSKTELVESPREIEHPIFRSVLSRYSLGGVDISVSADVPAGSGLGSSSSFTVGLLNLAHNLRGNDVSRFQLAAEACDIEINVLGEKIGKQDQYAAALGSLNQLTFLRESVVREEILLSRKDEAWLEDSMVLIQVGTEPRSTNAILSKQWEAAIEDKSKVVALQQLADLTLVASKVIRTDIQQLPALITEGWELKKLSNPFCTNSEIDELIDFGEKQGALGWKLLGAGQSGFVLFLVEPENREAFIGKFGEKKILRIGLDNQGSTVIYNDAPKVGKNV